MPVLNRIAEFHDDMIAWRRHLHQTPELLFETAQTASFVAERLREFGVDEIHEGIAENGVVAVIEGQAPGPVIGLRADMDALPIQEARDLPHKSQVPGKMHACGHDGHTTMLLGAARYLAETRSFRGRVALLFQPAEEDGGGGQVMVEEGVLDRFDIHEVYALHNAPDLPAGEIATKAGLVMGACDDFFFTITGSGGHAAFPQFSTDPIAPAVALAQALDTVVSRNRPSTEALVVAVTQIHAGTANNVIPGTARLSGTVRCFSPEMRDLAERRIREIGEVIATAFRVGVDLRYDRSYPPTVNDAHRTEFAVEVAREVVGPDKVFDDLVPEMGVEDFAYMLEARPGAYLFLGQGTTAGLHHPEYDFNDGIAPIGASFFARLVERALPLDG